MAAPTWLDYFNMGMAEAINRRPDLTFDTGDISDMYMAGLGAMADHLTGYVAGRFRATFLDGAQGDDLTVLADDHWAQTRFQATSAIGSVSFTRTNAMSAPSGTIPAGTVVATQKDQLGQEIQFTTDIDLAFGLGILGPLSVTCTAIVADIGGNVSAATVVRVLTQPAFDTFSVTNPARFAGGNPAETDIALRSRVRGLINTLRRGTLKALEYGAGNTPNGVVQNARAVEEKDPVTGIITGITDVYVSDAAGNSNATMVSAAATEGENWRAAGSIVNYMQGSLYDIGNVALGLSVRAGVDITAALATIRAAVVARIAKLKAGEALTPDIIKQAVANTDPDGILGVTVFTPAATIVPGPNQLIRVTGSNISVTGAGTVPGVPTFSPSHGAVGTVVVITGTAFFQATVVTLNGAPVNFTVVNDTTINFVVPVGAAGGLVAVTNPYGTATSTGAFGVP